MPKETGNSAEGAAASEKKKADKPTASKAAKKTAKATKSTKTAKAAKPAAAAKKKTAVKKKAAADKSAAERSAKKTTTAEKAVAKKAVTKKAEKSLRVRQIRSGIRHPWRMRRTLTALGLKHHQDEVVLPDNPSVRGMLRRVHHLVSVTPEDTNG